jgi:hypothetical protein
MNSIIRGGCGSFIAAAMGIFAAVEFPDVLTESSPTLERNAADDR